MSYQADILLVTVTKVESQAVLAVFGQAAGKPAEERTIEKRIYYDLGVFQGARVFMVQSEMGSGGLGAAQQVVQRGIDALSPNAVIMVGIAFGVNEQKQSIGDILVSTQLWLYELQRVGTQKRKIPLLPDEMQIIPRGAKPDASPALLNRFRAADNTWQEPKVRFGLILSGDKLVDNFDFRQQLKSFEPEANGGEMEGAGLYTACQDRKVDWILVKGICDWADGNKAVNKDDNQALAARNAAQFVLHALQVAPFPQQTKRAKIAQSLRAYLQLVSQQANLLPWANLTTDFADPNKGVSLRLEDVYVPLDTTRLEHVGREEELRAYLTRQSELERISAQAMLNQEPRLLIMGDPGSGKSTVTKFVTYQLAQAGLAADPTACLAELAPWAWGVLLPVRIEMRRLAQFLVNSPGDRDASQVLQFIHAELRIWQVEESWQALQEHLQQEAASLLFLLDGMDEVPARFREQVVKIISEFTALYPQHRYLVTCRPYAYIGQTWRLPGFQECTLAPFTQDQINRFITQWYDRLVDRDRLDRRQAAEKAQHLQQAVNRPDLLELAMRPLLLTVMAQLHAFAGKLPDDRTQLYADAVQLLLERWQSRLGDEEGLLEKLNIPGLELNDLKPGLYEVAFHAHQDSPSVGSLADISEANLRRWIAPYVADLLHPEGDWNKAGIFIDYIRERAGLLIRHKNEAYTFPHRSFQEFLAACHLLRQENFPGTMASLIFNDWDRWKDVMVLACGYAARTDRLSLSTAAVNELLPSSFDEVPDPKREDWRAALLAGEVLLEMGLLKLGRERAGRALLGRVPGWLVPALAQDELLDPRQRADAGRLLARLNDPRVEATSAAAISFCCVPAGPFSMGDGEEQHQLSLPAFWISRFPVTNAQFTEFVLADGYHQRSFWQEAEHENFWKEGHFQGRYDSEPRTAPRDFGEPFNLPNHPVVGITWYEALAYARWLDGVLRQKAQTLSLAELPEPERSFWQGLRLGSLSVTLPSEAQWEKSARGPSSPSRFGKGIEGLGPPYPWGETFDPNKANTSETGIGTTSAVGCFPRGASVYGVQELSGNVWEWTRSLYGKLPYPTAEAQRAERELLAAPVGNDRVLRGGSFIRYRVNARCAYRSPDDPDFRFRDCGFRVVVVP